ncbi:MAG: class I SAM-dependent methyltransferase, partial [Paraglaciecola sp.]|nr:class I SAM-dependent methyltransferase [Paraglaciecola sp.]
PKLGNVELCYVSSALYQMGEVEKAHKLVAERKLQKAEPALLAKLLISGSLNNLAKAHSCCFNHDKSDTLFELALNVGMGFTTTAAITNARATEQLSQLGIPRVASHNAATLFTPDIGFFLQSSINYFAENASIQLALAEHFQQAEQYNNAIVHWQQVSALLDKNTPQPYYDRLKEAYKLGKGFPQGTVEQESLTGDIDKHKLLSDIHARLKPEFYFEIGVQTGKSLALAKCEAIGVDPMPLLSTPLGPNAKVITSSSDAFFSNQSDFLLQKKLDLVFIDGMHLFEYALRDFINVEHFSHSKTIIIVDDIYPGHHDQASRNRCTKAWTGDVWKLHAVLKKYRPDLVIKTIDAYPTGLMLITGLNSENTVLNDNYSQIIDDFVRDIPVPPAYINRIDAVSGMKLDFAEILS